MSYQRPRFVREESWRYKRVKERWRSPRGKTSRVRRSKKGWPQVVKIGYARPRTMRGRHPSGLTETIVYRPKDLANLDPKTQAARIAHTVGENKRVQILEDAKKANIRVLNPGLKKPAEALAEVPPEPTTVTESAETKVEKSEAEVEPTVEEPTPSEPSTEETPKKRSTTRGKKKSKKKEE
jgi:large subunit ribosomal protein L32e